VFWKTGKVRLRDEAVAGTSRVRVDEAVVRKGRLRDDEAVAGK
jgi:hypothetical protein